MIRVSVHPLAPAGAFLLLFATAPVRAFAAVSSVLLHEGGHALAARLFRLRVRRVMLMPVGIRMDLETPRSYLEEVVVAAAGPAMNFLYAGAARLTGTALAEEILLFSLTLAFLNLLPIRTFDGGRLLHAVLAPRFGERTAEGALAVTTAASFSVLWTLSLYLFFYSTANGALLLFCAVLFVFLTVKNGGTACVSSKTVLQSKKNRKGIFL